MLLASSGYSTEKEAFAVETFLRSRVEGLVLTVADEEKSQTLSKLAAMQLPFVLMFNPVRETSYSTISIDNRQAAFDQVDTLLKLGHRRITMIAGKLSESDRSVERRAGYEDALRKRNLNNVSIKETEFENPDLSALIESIHKVPDAPTAYFCSTDVLAIATIRALTQIGKKIPNDVSVVGFDGIWVGELLSPSLATVVQPAEQMGEWATQHLISRIDNNEPVKNLMLPYTIRQGESSAAPAKQN